MKAQLLLCRVKLECSVDVCGKGGRRGTYAHGIGTDGPIHYMNTEFCRAPRLFVVVEISSEYSSIIRKDL